MIILGISAFYHDYAAAIVSDGEIVCRIVDAVHPTTFTSLTKHSVRLVMGRVNQRVSQT